MSIIYYVGLNLSRTSSDSLAIQLGLPAGSRFHSTIAYSREWFPYKRWNFQHITTQATGFDVFNNVKVITYESELVRRRHKDLIEAGAVWDWPNFNSHVTIGGKDIIPITLPPLLHFDLEYYGTWKEL